MSRSYLYLILAMVSWGIANPFSDLAVEYLPVSQMFVLEIASGVLVLSLFFRKSWFWFWGYCNQASPICLATLATPLEP
jgi:drug/metabolite transporter (DMT)-like permease